MAHILTAEKSFQQSYSAGGQIDTADLSGWSLKFAEHTYYLLPLCVSLIMPKSASSIVASLLTSPIPESVQPLAEVWWLVLALLIWMIGSYCLDSRNGWCFFPGMPYFKRVVHCNIATDPLQDAESRKADLALLRAWSLDRMPSHNQSSHWWFRDLTGEQYAAFERCANSSHIARAFRNLFSEEHYCMEVIDGMNEIYVTGPSRFEQEFNSDQVFYSRHVDGPYGLFPFVSVYRCIVGMDKNNMISTNYPMIEYSIKAKEGDVVAFDFNREIHYITCDESQQSESDTFRVVLKLHYCVYPRILAPIGRLMHWANVQYNKGFRALFLKTINPQTPYEHFLAWNVVTNTFLFHNLETLIGLRNLIYVTFLLGLWHFTGYYEWFLIGTSYVHYIRYISTYYFRDNVDYGSFKRDVFLFKSLAVAQLLYFYFFPAQQDFQWDLVSLGMIVVGYAISVKATKALGIDRTYFGAELGYCEPKWIEEFPYGYIPHPMIVCQIVSLLGFLKADHFVPSFSYLIHFHILFYLTHMVQENYDIHKATIDPWMKKMLHKAKTA